LTIDAAIQTAAYDLLQKNETPGAVIVQDPRNGHLLAMASWPSFDPNLFPAGINRADWRRLENDPESPLTNRATTAAAPGLIARIIPARPPWWRSDREIHKCPPSTSRR
jgi:penicillin-binding protein 2